MTTKENFYFLEQSRVHETLLWQKNSKEWSPILDVKSAEDAKDLPAWQKVRKIRNKIGTWNLCYEIRILYVTNLPI